MRDIGLWRGQLPVLEYISAHEGCTQSALAKGLGLSAATVAVSTKRLARAGHITKAADEKNLRCNKLFVTDAGRETMRAACLVAANHNRAVFSALTKEEQDTLVFLVDKLLLSLDCTEQDLAPLNNFILHNKLESKETER